MKSNYLHSNPFVTAFIFSFLLFSFFSCRNDDDFGDQCFDNRTNEPIDLYIDGNYEFTIDEDNQDCLFFGDGCFDWYVEGVLSGDFSEGTFCSSIGGFSSTIVIDN